MTSTNCSIRPLAVILTVGLLVLLLLSFAVHPTHASQRTILPALGEQLPKVTGFKGIQEGQSIVGNTEIEAVVSGNNITQVVFQLDGPQSKKYTDRRAPYFFRGDKNGVPYGWGTTGYPNGDYTLTATASDKTGRSGALNIHFRIANNTSSQPTATPIPIPQAGTFYVSPGGSDSNPGTLTQPWRTFSKAASTLHAGETAIFQDGIYNENQTTAIANNGTATAPITFKAANTQKAILLYSGSTGGDKIYITKQHIVIQGFEITQNTRGTTDSDKGIACWGGADYCTLIGNKVHNVYEDCFKIAFNDHATLDGNTCYDVNREGIDVFNVSNIIIRNNDIVAGRTGIMAKGGARSVQVYNNYVHTSSSMDSAIALGDFSCVPGCKVFDPSGYEGYNQVAWNNVVVSETPGNIYWGLLIRGCTNCAFFNNVVIGAIHGLATYKGGGPSEGWTWQTLANNPTFENNIIIDCSASATDFSGIQGSLTLDYNLFFNCPNVPSQAHGVYADPTFVDKLSDWHLQPGSPATNAGLPSTFAGFYGESIDISQNREGIRRGAQWNIGIY